MKYRKYILFILLALLVSLPVRAEVVDRIAAVVNDEIITLSELNAAFAPYEQNIENTYKGKDKDSVIRQTREAFFQRMIDGILIEQEAKKTGISIRDEDVMNVLQGMLTKQKINMDEFMKNLAREGSSPETVKKEIRSQIIRMRLLKKEVRDKIMITDEEIGEYYNKHRLEYEGKESVRIKQLLLLLPAGAGPNEKKKLKDEARLLRERILKGESFDALTAQYSQGPAAAQGGDVGFVEKGTIIPEVETVAFSLHPEQVSDVIESAMGFHVIKVIDKKGAGLKPIAVVREEIKEKIENEKLDKKYEEWITSVREKAHIETRL